MDSGIIIRHINVIVAIVSIPPALAILHTLLRERYLLKTENKPLNNLLLLLFSGIIVGALLNAFLSVLSLLGYMEYVSKLSIYRSTYTSAFFSFVTWSIYLFQRWVKRNKN